MLKLARVRGYKCLHDVSVELSPLTVLIGPNDSGKSAFLEAVSEPSRIWLGAPLSRSCKVRLETDGETILYDSTNPFVPRQGSSLAKDEDLGTLAWASGAAVARAEEWLKSRPAFRVSDPVQLDATAVAADSHPENATLDATIRNHGFGTGAYLGSLALGDRERFDRIEGALRGLTGGRVKNIVVQDKGNSTYAVSFRLFDGTAIPARDLSQGLLLYLGFLALVHRSPMPGVLLVEEPESGLHLSRLYELMQLFRSLVASGTQIILTTHSPDLLSACDPSEVRVFRRPNADSPTEVKSLPRDFLRRAMRETLGEVWASRGEEGLLDETPPLARPAIQADSE